MKEYAHQSELRTILEAKIIQKSVSDYAFPVLFVKKKSTEKNAVRYVLAIDYGTINEILEEFPYPLTDVKDTLLAKMLYSVGSALLFFPNKFTARRLL